MLVIIDVQPKELGIPTKAYYAVEEVKEVRYICFLISYVLYSCILIFNPLDYILHCLVRTLLRKARKSSSMCLQK